MKKEIRNPLLSVIIPVYNTEEFVRKCLDSVLKQTYDHLEIILVNDASTGSIREIAAEYQKKYSNVKLVNHESNRGLFQARLTGLKAATGDYFAFVDSDDYLGCDLYRVMMKKAVECDADIVATDRREEMRSGLYSPHDMLQQLDWDLQGAILDTLMEQRGMDCGWWVVWNKVYARHIWEDSRELLEQYDGHLIMCEDCAFSMTFFAQARHFVNVHSNYYYYYRGDNSSTIQKCSADKYRKNILDIKTAFSIGKQALQAMGCWESLQENWRLWQNEIAVVWKDRISGDKQLPKQDREELLQTLKPLLHDGGLDPCDRSREFCCRGAMLHGRDPYEEIKQAIIAKDCKLVSFDIFDTLVVRPFFYPTDLFHLLDSYINQMLPSIDYLVFTHIRITAEQEARKRKQLATPSWQEVTLDEIYAEMAILCPAVSNYIDRIKEKEIELELKYCTVRKAGRELVECAAAAGKTIVLTSDMYLPRSVVEKLLAKNGYAELIDGLYLSSEIGLTKSSGKLFDHVLKKCGVAAKQAIHIGDNWDSDVMQARKAGMTAFHLPKTIDIFCNHNGAIYSGTQHYRIFEEQKGLMTPQGASFTWGIRTMEAVAANRLFDNPFVVYDPGSDFNADSYTIGYFALGMHMYAIADWLVQSVQENGYDNLCFMARDGYVPYEAFKMLNRVYGADTKTHYLYLSRKAILPLMLIGGELDMYSLYNGFNLSTLTADKFIKIANILVRPEAYKNRESILAKHGIPLQGTFNTIEAFLKFSQVFMREFYSETLAGEYKEHMRAYLADMFRGKAATFDVGYNARCESILKSNFGYDITAHYIHTNNDRPFGRIEKSGIKLKTLYGQLPYITGIMREQLMSELAPSCIGYEWKDGEFVPKFEELELNLQTRFVTSTMQQAALDFVRDMVQTFGEDLRHLAYRYQDACIPMEWYLCYARPADQSIFNGVLFEDDMGMGNHKSLVDFWNQERTRFGCEQRNPPADRGKSPDEYPFVKRWFYLLSGDWNEPKKRFANYWKRKFPPVYLVTKLVYKGTRGAYRLIKGNGWWNQS